MLWRSAATMLAFLPSMTITQQRSACWRSWGSQQASAALSEHQGATFDASSLARHAHAMRITTAVVSWLPISKPPALLERVVTLLLWEANKLYHSPGALEVRLSSGCLDGSGCLPHLSLLFSSLLFSSLLFSSLLFFASSLLFFSSLLLYQSVYTSGKLFKNICLF